MVTQKEYAKFQENYDRAHREGRVTNTDYAIFQGEHDRTHPLNPNGSPAYVTEEEYGRFQDSYGFVNTSQTHSGRTSITINDTDSMTEEEKNAHRQEKEAREAEERKRAQQRFKEEESRRIKRQAEEKQRIEAHNKRLNEAKRMNQEQDELIEGASSPLKMKLAQRAFGGVKGREERDELIKKDKIAAATKILMKIKDGGR